jgi:hypothetical protein
MRTFILVSMFEHENKKFDKLSELIQFYDQHPGNYTHYLFAIPLLGYYRRDEFPDLNDQKVREKYALGAKLKLRAYSHSEESLP